MGKEQKSLVSLINWNLAPDFSGDEITALVLGEAPTLSNYTNNRGLPLYRKLENSYNAFRRWHDLDGRVPVKWQEIGVSSKDEMLYSIDVEERLSHFDPDDADNRSKWLASDEHSGFASQRFTRTEVARWLTACGIQSVYKFIGGQSTDESLSTKERNTLLKIIVGMAIKGYAYDPASAKNDAPKEIESDIAKLGMSVTDDTIRKYLKEAVEMILQKKVLKP
jgi:hypothetical protein